MDHSRTRRLSRLEPLRKLLDDGKGAIKNSLLWEKATLEGLFRGRSVNFSLTEQRGYTGYPEFRVTLHSEIAYLFEVRQKQATRELRHLQKDVEPDYPPFRTELKCTSEDPKGFSAWLGRAEIQAALETLMLSLGIHRLTSIDTLEARYVRYESPHLKIENVENILQCLLTLTQSLERNEHQG